MKYFIIAAIIFISGCLDIDADIDYEVDGVSALDGMTAGYSGMCPPCPCMEWVE